VEKISAGMGTILLYFNSPFPFSSLLGILFCNYLRKSGGMLSRQFRYAIPAHIIPLQALTKGQKGSHHQCKSKLHGCAGDRRTPSSSFQLMQSNF